MIKHDLVGNKLKNQNKLKCNEGQKYKLPDHSNEELEFPPEVEIDEEVRGIILRSVMQ